MNRAWLIAIGLIGAATQSEAQFGYASSAGVNAVGSCSTASCFTAASPSTQLTFTSSGGSGTATLRCPTSTALGSLTHVLPTTSGTFAVSASSPLSLNTTTGVMSLGTVAVANGGTGQTTATAGFDALAPSSVAGDILGHDGSSTVRVAVGADNTVLTADANQASGVKWATALSGFGGDGSDGSCTWNGSAWSPSACFFGCGNTSPCTVAASQAISFGTSTSAPAPTPVSVKPVAMKQFSSLSISGTAYTVNFASGIERVAILVSGNATISSGTLNMRGNGKTGGGAGANGGALACNGGSGGSTQIYGGGAAGTTSGTAGGSAAAVDSSLFRYPWATPWALAGGGGGGGCLGRTNSGGNGVGLSSSLWGSVNFAAAGGGGGGCTASASSAGTASAGGNGGGVVYFEIGGTASLGSGFAVNVSGADASAASGTTNSSGGGGGGGGAAIALYRSGSVNTSSWTAAGGTGATAVGSGCGNGGNGGTGLIVAKQIF